MNQQQAVVLSSNSENQASSSESSPSSSISLVKVDELSAFGATKRSRLPALIKLQDSANAEMAQQVATNQPLASMPALSAQHFETTKSTSDDRQASLPAHVAMDTSSREPEGAKENQEESGDFQVVDMISADLMGPSLPQPQPADKVLSSSQQINQQQQQSSMLGGSLIDMIVNLRNENQNLVRALETNNEYVKDRLSEFKRIQEESKRREAQFALEKAEHEHQVRKLQRQNLVLSERLKSMEAKLKDMKLEVSESLAAAHSSRASSQRDAQEQQDCLYPNLDSADLQNLNTLTSQQNAATMQMDATNDELNNASGPSAPMESNVESAAARVGAMSKEELSKRFDADKAAFYAMEDPLQQCDQLEKQLNEIGKRDYEICLLQQQLNIYRQDYRMEKMANLEAKIQIEKLKNDIDRLCLERLMERNKMNDTEAPGQRKAPSGPATAGLRLAAPAAAAADAVISRLGHQLSRKAARSAAKAARYASKQAHLEEKAAAAAARAAAAQASSSSSAGQYERRHSHHGRHGRSGGIKSEVVNDLLSTANKAMLTGYKMASTHVNLAIDKLSQFEQAQASHLEKNKQQTAAKNQASNMGPPSVD